MERFDTKLDVINVEMLVNGLSSFDDRVLLDESLLHRHCDVSAREQDCHTDKQYKLHTDTHRHTYRYTDKQYTEIQTHTHS